MGIESPFYIIIDREAREIMHLVASVRPSVRPSVRLPVHLFALSRLNCLSNKSRYQFKVFVCVSVISGRMRIITRMRSIGVLIF